MAALYDLALLNVFYSSMAAMVHSLAPGGIRRDNGEGIPAVRT
ncbi:hypothetical protein [Streptomyces sp. NPDC005322]